MGPGGPTVIHVGYTPANIEEVYFPHASVVGDVGPSLALLADRLEGRLPNASALLHAARRHPADDLRRGRRGPLPDAPQRIVADVRAVMPDDGIVALDNGMYKIWFARNYRTPVSNTLLLDNALATMGAGLPSAMMAAILYPDRRVLAVCGDGGFMMNSQELETAVRLGLNLVVLILQDNAYGMIRWKQAVDNFADFGLTFGNPDFVKYAEAYGATRITGRSPPKSSFRPCTRRSTPAASTWSLSGRLLRERPRPRRRAAQPRPAIAEVMDDEHQSRSARRPWAPQRRTRSPSRWPSRSSNSTPGPGEVLVRIKAAGLCHSDLSVINGNRPRPTADGAGARGRRHRRGGRPGRRGRRIGPGGR